MKIKSFCIIFVLIFLSTGIYASGENISYKPNSFLFSHFLINNLPGAYFYPSFFENFAPDTTLLIEENDGFSLIDSPRIYYEGDSFINFNWSYNGFSINSSLDHGAPGILLPFSSIKQYELKGESPFYKDYGLNFISSAPEKTSSQIVLSTVWSNLGSYVPLATSMVDPHATTAGRNPVLYSNRRKILSNFLADYIYCKKFRRSTLYFNLSYFDIERQFNDFNEFDSVFMEHGKLVLLHAEYEKKYKDSSLHITGVFNDLSRDRMSAELGRLPQETRKKEKQSIFSGLRFKKKNFNLRLSFLHESENLSPSRLNYLKDLKDIDGEGFFPFEQLGSFYGNVFRLNFDVPFKFYKINKKTEVDIFADLKFAFLRGSEDKFDFNPISFDRSPYLVILWSEGKPYHNTNTQMKIGTILNTTVSDNFSLFAKLLFQYSSLRFRSSENNLSLLSAGFDSGIMLFKNKNPEILFSYGQIPYELRENVNFFLEKDKPWGTLHRWADQNNDLQYQSGEEGQIFGYTGGPFHSLDRGLRIPIKKRFLVSISTKISQRFRLNIKGIFKKITNNLWVKYKEDYGIYEISNDRNLYYFTRPFKDYVLSNYSFDKEPFYGQLLFHLIGSEEKKWFFSFSFMAQIGMGYTAFGNGPAANDIGILSESQANPNSWINGYGRVDGDRAYVGKMYFGFYITKKLFIAANLKYRDGHPFAFINTSSAYNQRIFYFNTIQAENEKGIKGGPREDYVSDISFKIKYEFRLINWNAELSISLFNLFDFGSELSEYVFSGGDRYANELQIPRSIRIGLSLKP